MGMGAWPDSRVVRRSSSESADFPQKCQNGFWWWNIPRKEIRNYPWRESSYFFAAHLFGFRQKNRFSCRRTFWTQKELFWVKKVTFSQKVFATWGQNPEKVIFEGKKKTCGHAHISTRILSISENDRTKTQIWKKEIITRLLQMGIKLRLGSFILSRRGGAI